MNTTPDRNTYSTPDSLPGFPGIPSSFHCRVHRKAHLHYIPLFSPTPEIWEPARITGAEGHYLTFSYLDTTERRWTHDADRLQAVADIASLEPEAMTLWSPGRRILKVSVGDVGFLIDLFQGRAQNCRFGKAS